MIDKYRDEGMLGGLHALKLDFVEISTKRMIDSHLRNHEFDDMNNYQIAWLDHLAQENNFFNS